MLIYLDIVINILCKIVNYYIYLVDNQAPIMIESKLFYKISKKVLLL